MQAWKTEQYTILDTATLYMKVYSSCNIVKTRLLIVDIVARKNNYKPDITFDYSNTSFMHTLPVYHAPVWCIYVCINWPISSV